MLKLFLLLILLHESPLVSSAFLFDSFSPNDLLFAGDARIDSSSVIRLTSNDEKFSMGRSFYPYIISKRSTNMKFASFSTSFIFSIVSEVSNHPGFGFAFVISNDTVPPGSPNGHYFGLFSNSSVLTVAHLLVVEFDCGKNPEFDDPPNGNHIGVNLNTVESVTTKEAGYYNSTTGEFVPISMRSGENIQAWIELDGIDLGINVSIAPVGKPKPSKPLISFYSPVITSYITGNVYVGFSASRLTWLETQRILAWTLAEEGTPRDMNTSNLPVFRAETSSTSALSSGLIVGIIVISVLALLFCLSGFYWFCIRKRMRSKDDDDVQSWELDYWPHRFSYEELAQATKGFSVDELLGSGGFGSVFKGREANNSMIAVKCTGSDSSQGFKEFMAEISSIGRLQHKNLVRMKGWCKKGSEMLLVYDYMPNGSLYSWIFNKSTTISWERRLLVLMDVAEGLNYLHNGWDHLVLHRDIKSSNILLDADMRGRLGDFGLAKLCKHGQVSLTTHLVGTLGYMAPELVKAAATRASDIYSFGVVMLEVACGRRPIEVVSGNKQTLVDCLGMLQEEGRLNEAADSRIAGEYKVDDMEMVLKLGLACCDTDPKMRPSMQEVLSSLMILKPPTSSDYFSSSKFEPINYRDEEGTSMTSTISVITDPGPRT